ncbi:MAG: hypothetical protein Q9204_005775, partial [Flavoplaca sp. TL-2023a]
LSKGRKFSSKTLSQTLFIHQTLTDVRLDQNLNVAEHLNTGHDLFLAITTDRPKGCPSLVMSHGGVSGIEGFVGDDLNVLKVPLNYAEGVTEEMITILSERFALDRKQLTAILQGLFTFYKASDATLIEINPLIRESESSRLIYASFKISIDDAASKRQNQIFSLRDKSQEMTVELEAEKHGLVYNQLEGNIGCLVNGAGLAMATNDAVAEYGGRCANFLDGGGQATKETMVKAFELILSDKRVNRILVNIYGGKFSQHVRLGTNLAVGQKVIAESGLKLLAEDDLESAVKKAIQFAGPSRPSPGAIFSKATASSGSSTLDSQKPATSNALATMAYGTQIIGGVSPSIHSFGPHPSPSLSHLPAVPTLRIAISSFPFKPHATAVFVLALHAASAILEAIEAEIPLIVSVAKHVPLHDMFRVQAALRSQSASRLVGPNCPGIIGPAAKCRIGIMPHLQYRARCVGIVSKSGTLSYEAVGATKKVGLGQSLCIGVGGEMLPATNLREILKALLRDEATKGIIGGEAEIEAAEFLKEWDREAVRKGGKRKPVVGMITGRTAPKGRVMGHAGAVADGIPTASDKIKALEDAGVTIAVHPGEIGHLMRALLEREGLIPVEEEQRKDR